MSLRYFSNQGSLEEEVGVLGVKVEGKEVRRVGITVTTENDRTKTTSFRLSQSDGVNFYHLYSNYN